MVNLIDMLLRRFHSLCQYLPQIMIILSVIVLAGSVILGGVSLVSKTALILVPLIIASIICLISKKKDIASEDLAFSLNIPQRRLYFLFGIIFSLLLIWIEMGNNDLIKLVFISILYLLILLQLFSRTPKPFIILIEIMLTTAIIALPQMLVPAYYQAGGGDIFVHSYYGSTILNTGFTLPSEIAGAYTSFNLYHILLAVSSLITSLEINVSLYVFTTIPFISVIPFIYLITQQFFKSVRICLLAAFFYAITPIILYIMIIPTPRIMGTIAFTIILYLLFHNWKQIKIAPFILVATVSAYMAMVHHMQQPLFYMVIAILCLGSLLYFKTFFSGNKTLLLIVCGISFGYIVYNYLSSVIQQLDLRLFNQIETNAISSVNVELVGTSSTSIDLSILISGLATSIMVLFIFTALYSITTSPKRYVSILVLLPFFFLAFIFFVPGVSEVFPSLSQAMQIARFRLVWASLFAIVIALGCILLFNMISSLITSKNVVVTLVLILCMLFVFSSAIYVGCQDNDVYYNIDLGVPRAHYIYDTDISAHDFLVQYINTMDTTKIRTSHEWGGYQHSPSVRNYLGRSYLPLSLQMADAFIESEQDLLLADEYLLFNKIRYLKNGLEALWYEDNNRKYVEYEYYEILASEENTNVFYKNMYQYQVLYMNGNNVLFH